MDEQKRAKKFLAAGAIAGGILSLTISLLMDSLFSDAMQGTWRDAIAKDLNNIFSATLSSGSIIVTIAFLFVLALLAAFGAFMGTIFSFFLYKFFELLGKK
jgi:hypothetical protein